MSNLGGGIKGIAPRPVRSGTMNGSSEFETVRFSLRKAWNGKAASENINGYAPAATPFRIVNNAGDYLSRQYYSSGGSNQVTSARSSITAGWRGSAGQLSRLQMLQISRLLLATPSMCMTARCMLHTRRIVL